MDLITVEVIRGALSYAAEEMGIALRKSAYSHNIKERMDHSCAIFDERRRLVAQAEHIPVHLGSMSFAVTTGLDSFAEELEDGDMLMFNDPYISGTHLPDVTLIAPVILRGEVIAYVANKAHHSDVGGKAPGSLPGDATELFQEGIIIPPVKFVKHGLLDEEIANIVLSNVRTPEIRMGDLRAQVAANNLGARRFLRLVDRYGLEVVNSSIEEIMSYSERRMRAQIAGMLPGEYEAEDYLESTGVSEEPAKISVKVNIKGEEIDFDYSGTDSQVEGPVNAVLGVTMAGVYFVLMCVTDPTIPVNEGCYRPITIQVPKGSLLNPLRPAPVGGGNVETSQRNVDVLFKAFSQILPEKVCAAGQGTMNNVCVGGVDPKTRKQWVLYETIGGGYGGRPGMDGVDGVHVHMTNTMNTPVEAIERAYPLRFLKYGLRKDSGGPGKWRGGCGIERSWQLLGPSAILSLQAERHEIKPWGLFGGKPASTGEAIVMKPSGDTILLKSKCTVGLSRGDVFVIRTPGGGGYGEPMERDPGCVLRDFVDGLVSLQSAQEHYGVVIDEDQKKVDVKATNELRRSRLSGQSGEK